MNGVELTYLYSPTENKTLLLCKNTLNLVPAGPQLPTMQLQWMGWEMLSD